VAVAKNLEFYLTETWIMDVTCHDANNRPLNINNAVITFILKDNMWNTMFTLNNASGVIVTNAVAGQCSVIATPAIQNSANIVDKTYKYELQVVLGDGTVTTQCVGELDVNASLFGNNN
jgi:hypothetical protein